MTWWATISGPDLAQGDLLPDCLVPVVVDVPMAQNEDEVSEVEIKKQRLIVVTQSCDLENNKVDFVALCPIHTLDEFETHNPNYGTGGRWESVRKGRVEALHLLASPEQPHESRQAYVVDFAHIISLPLAYLSVHASGLGDRWRLRSPFLEHLSQSFARFFMRVGLPAQIPPFR